jgi:hypothetical protein
MLLDSSHSRGSTSALCHLFSIPCFSYHLQRETRSQRRRILFDFNTLANDLETAYSKAQLPSSRTKRRAANDPSCSLSIRRINEVYAPARKKSRTVMQDVSPAPPVYIPPLSSIQPCRLVHGKLLFPTPVVAIFLPQGGRF